MEIFSILSQLLHNPNRAMSQTKGLRIELRTFESSYESSCESNLEQAVNRSYCTPGPPYGGTKKFLHAVTTNYAMKFWCSLSAYYQFQL